MDLTTSSEIKKVALMNHRHGGISHEKFVELSKQFEHLTDEELEKERIIIENEKCGFNTESVFKYRVGIGLFNFIKNNRK